MIIGRILDLTESEVVGTLASTTEAFVGRHPNLTGVFERNFQVVVDHIE
jgi:hypothetical protein